MLFFAQLSLVADIASHAHALLHACESWHTTSWLHAWASTLLQITVSWWLQELCKRAEDMGIKWGLEVINRYESNVCNTGLRVGLLDFCSNHAIAF